jgi:hypothetical protein
VKESPEARGEIRMRRERPHPLTHRASRLLVGSLPPLLCASRSLFGPRSGVPESICKAHGITSFRQKEWKCSTTPSHRT